MSETEKYLLPQQGEIRGAIENLVDETEHKCAEEALVKSGEGYRTLAANFSDGFVLIQDGIILLLNKSYRREFPRQNNLILRHQAAPFRCGFIT